MTSKGTKITSVKTIKRSLVEAQIAVGEDRLHVGRQSSERAVLVAVEFTGERRKLTSAARLARKAAAVSAGVPVGVSIFDESGPGEVPAEPQQAADLDFGASLAEFEELARRAGAEVSATLIQRPPPAQPAPPLGPRQPGGVV